MQPVGLFVFLTFEPNGHKHKSPILKVCKAIGNPIMVIANAKLPVKYPMAASSPPKIHQIILPNIFIYIYFFVRSNKEYKEYKTNVLYVE